MASAETAPRFFTVSIQQMDENQRVLVVETVMNAHSVHAVLKQPLQPITIIMPTIGFATMTDVPLHPAWVEFETKEGGKVFINPKHVLFYTNPSLGEFALFFPGGSRMAVKATTAEIREKLDPPVNLLKL